MRQRSSASGSFHIVVTLLLASACTGEMIGRAKSAAGARPTVPEGAACTQGAVGTSGLLRITRTQYDHTAADLFGTAIVPSQTLSTDDRVGTFSINSETLMSRGLAEQYQYVAEAIGVEVEANVFTRAPCAKPTTDGATCARTFLQTFGRRAFRRPLDTDELNRWVAVYTTAASTGAYATGIRTVVEAMLQSPSFLYRLELAPVGKNPDDPNGYAVDAYALASRLSYMLWNSGPDDALLDAAAAGELEQPASLQAKTDAMFSDDRSLRSMDAFGEGWAGLDTLSAAASSPIRLGGLDPALVPLMRAETVSFLDTVLRKQDGRFATLMSATFTVADPKVTSAFYGITTPPGATGETPLDPTQRSGILTHPSLMFTHAHSEQTSPVLRGKWVRENLFCQKMPDPPANVNTTPPAPVPGQTARQRFAQHSSDPTCASCHSLMDDIGFSFENYDQYGKFRTTDASQPVDASGVLRGTDSDGSFTAVRGLAAKLSQSPTAHDCFAKQWFQFDVGRMPSASEACLVSQLSTTMKSGGGYAAYVRLLTASEVFHTRRSP